jgi:hypothetical protein
MTFRNIGAEIGIRRTVGCKNTRKEQWEKVGMYVIKISGKRWEERTRV